MPAITKRRAAAIVSARPYATLDDLERVASLKTEAQRSTLVTALLAGGRRRRGSVENAYVIDKSKIYPRFSGERVPQSVLTCSIQSNCIGYAHIDSNFTVNQWNQVQLFDKPRSKYDHVTSLNRIHEIINRLPRADLCIVEDLQTRGGAQVPVVEVNRIRVEVAFTTCLSLLWQRGGSDSSATTELPLNLVYKMKPNVVGDLFDLLVGGERVTSKQVINDILRGTSDHVRHAHLEEETAMFYRRLEGSSVRERAAATLLQGFAFYKLLQRNVDDEH